MSYNFSLDVNGVTIMQKKLRALKCNMEFLEETNNTTGSYVATPCLQVGDLVTDLVPL